MKKNSILTVMLFLLFSYSVLFGAIPQSEREALIALYNSTDGDNWNYKDNWLGPPGTEDTWYGISVTSDHVTSVDLRSNNLTGSIPPEFGNLTNLLFLSLRNNQLTGSIPTEFSSLIMLQNLDLWDNQLTAIPPALGNLTNLQYLNLCSNQFTAIPPELGNLTNLQYLVLSDNQLTGSIPPEFGGLINLQDLDLGWNQLTGTIPPELGSLPNLQNLDLRRNQLTGLIPSELSYLTNLQNLDLSDNQLMGIIPPELGNLTNLQNLNLSDNQFTTIPPEFGNLTNLQSLYLSGNLLRSIPPEFGYMTNLQHLYLGGNQIRSIPPELGNLTNLQHLHLYNNQLIAIPPEFGNLTNLQSLYLSGNLLRSILPEFGYMTMLQNLDLSSNQLSGSIPLELCHPSNLEYLNLNGNQLTGSIPPELCSMIKLQDLDLGCNQFSGSIPSALGLLDNLQYLNLRGNQLTSAIPPALGYLANLRGLQLGGNQLSGSIPAEIVNLTSLNDNGSDFRWNALYTDADSIRVFLNSKQFNGNWENTQTVAPADLSVTPLSGATIKLSWTPIQYTSDDGGYRIFQRIAPGGPWTEAGMTEDKNAFEFEVTELNPGTTYYFVVQTQTDPHSDNQNTVLSEYSEEVSVTTLQHYVLTITSGTGGTTEPAPGTYNCDPGTEVSIKAIPNRRYKFSRWSGDASGTSNQVTIFMDSDKNVTASFMKEEKGACFVATAAYGSPLHPYIDILRDFRDRYLMTNELGREFVDLYYKYSPYVAERIANYKILKVVVRIQLSPLVALSYSMVYFGPIMTTFVFVLIFMLPIFLIPYSRRKFRRTKTKAPKA